MKTRNEKITLINTENITCSFSFGVNNINDELKVYVYYKEWEQFCTSSTGVKGFSKMSTFIFDYGCGSISSSNKNIKESINDIILQLAYSKYNCVYNPTIKKYFKRISL